MDFHLDRFDTFVFIKRCEEDVLLNEFIQGKRTFEVISLFFDLILSYDDVLERFIKFGNYGNLDSYINFIVEQFFEYIMFEYGRSEKEFLNEDNKTTNKFARKFLNLLNLKDITSGN